MLLISQDKNMREFLLNGGDAAGIFAVQHIGDPLGETQGFLFNDFHDAHSSLASPEGPPLWQRGPFPTDTPDNPDSRFAFAGRGAFQATCPSAGKAAAAALPHGPVENTPGICRWFPGRTLHLLSFAPLPPGKASQGHTSFPAQPFQEG